MLNTLSYYACTLTIWAKENGICGLFIRSEIIRRLLCCCIYLNNILQKNISSPGWMKCIGGTYYSKSINGCKECFCSGVSKSCRGYKLYRKQIQLNPIEDKLILTNRQRSYILPNTTYFDSTTNAFCNSISPSGVYYWSLPKNFLGNQILSYGGEFKFTSIVSGTGSCAPWTDVILIGNGCALSWLRRNVRRNRSEEV